MKTLPPYPTGLVPDSDQVYPPREDTFLLLQKAQSEIQPDDLVLEVGTGSGYIASALHGCRLIIGTDINPHAVMQAKSRGAYVIRTDIAAGIKRIFTLILFNPPYIPTRPEERCDDWLEYALDGGPDGRGPLKRFLVQIPDLLIPKGRVLVLISSLQEFDTCEAVFRENRYSYEIIGNKVLEDGEELRVYRLKGK